jgi:F-type H+-transporting ATPase subunit b
MLLERKGKVSGLENDVNSFSESAKEKDAAFYEGIKTARAKGLKEKEALIQDAENEEKKVVAGINEKAQADLADVKSKIAKDAEAVKVQLLKQIDTFANEIGEKILGRAV